MVQREAWSNSSNAAPHRHTSSLQSLRSHSQNSIVFGTALHPRARDRTSSIPPAFHIGGRTKIGALTAGSGYSRRSAHCTGLAASSHLRTFPGKESEQARVGQGVAVHVI